MAKGTLRVAVLLLFLQLFYLLQCTQLYPFSVKVTTLSSEQVQSPCGIAVDANHTLYIASPQKNIIYSLHFEQDPLNIMTVKPIVGEPHVPGYEPSLGRIGTVYDIAIQKPPGHYEPILPHDDNDDEQQVSWLYFADRQHFRVGSKQVVPGNYVNEGHYGFNTSFIHYAGDGIQGVVNSMNKLESRFASLTDIAFDSKRNLLYIAEKDHHIIRKIDHKSGQVSTFAGLLNDPGYVDGHATAQARFHFPNSLIIDENSGDVFVLEAVSQGRVRRISSKDLVVSTIVESLFPESTHVSGSFSFSGDIDSAGNIWIAVTQEHRIFMLDAKREYQITEIVGSHAGKRDGIGRGSIALFNSPYSIAIDSNGYIFVTDTNNHRIALITVSCFGVLKTEKDTVCSGRGNCTAMDHCQCQEGYYGKNCENGGIFGFGSNAHYGLVLENSEAKVSYGLLKNLSSFNFKMIKQGKDLNLALDHYGSVYCWGLNCRAFSVSDSAEPTPRKIQTLRDIGRASYIEISYTSAFVVMENGKLYVFGKNDHGILGLGDLQERLVPTLVPDSRFNGEDDYRVHNLWCQTDHCHIALSSGSVFATGRNNAGQLLLEFTGPAVSTPARITHKEIKSLEISHISHGALHTLVLTLNRRVLCAGDNQQGQCGLGHLQSPISQISLVDAAYGAISIQANSFSSYVLKHTRELFVFGSNQYSQLTSEPLSPIIFPTKINIPGSIRYIRAEYTENQFYAYLQSGSIIACGKNDEIELGIQQGNTYCGVHPVSDPSLLYSIISGYKSSIFMETTCFGKLISDSEVCSGNGECLQHDYCLCYAGFVGRNCEVEVTCKYPIHITNNHPTSLEKDVTLTLPMTNYITTDWYSVRFYRGGEEIDRDIITSNDVNTVIRFKLHVDIAPEGELKDTYYILLRNHSQEFTRISNIYLFGDDMENLENWSEVRNGNFELDYVDGSHVLRKDPPGEPAGASAVFPELTRLRSEIRWRRLGLTTQGTSTRISFYNDHQLSFGVGIRYSEINSQPSKLAFDKRTNGLIGDSLGSDVNVNFSPDVWYITDCSLTASSISCSTYNNFITVGPHTRGFQGAPNIYRSLAFQGGFSYAVDYVKIQPLIDNEPSIEMMPSLCECNNDNFYGDLCAMYQCYGIEHVSTTACSSNGICDAPNHCTCSFGYLGNQCEIHTCYGISFLSPDVCSSNGTCSSIDVCNCNEGYVGYECHIPICYGKLGNSSSVCSNRNGTCVARDTCSCHEGYTGNECEIPICFGFDAFSEQVCSFGNGSCIAKDTCDCSSCYIGDECSLNTCLQYSFIMTEASFRDTAYINKEYIIHFQSNVSIAQDIQHHTYCVDEFNTSTKFPANFTSLETFSCKIISDTVKKMSIRIQVYHYIVSERGFVMDFINKSNISFTQSSRKVFLNSEPYALLSIHFDLSSIPDQRDLFCTTNTGFNVKAIIDEKYHTLNCTILPNSQYGHEQLVSVEYQRSHNMTVSTNSLSIAFISQGAIQLKPSSSSLVLTEGESSFEISIDPSSFFLDYHMIFCKFGESTIKVEALRMADGSFFCPLSTKPLISTYHLTLWINDTLEIPLSNNSVSIWAIQEIQDLELQPGLPDVALTDHSPVSLTLVSRNKEIFQHNESKIGYICTYEMEESIFEANVSLNETEEFKVLFNCTIDVPNFTTANHISKISVSMVSKVNTDTLKFTNLVEFTWWKKINITKLSPFIKLMNKTEEEMDFNYSQVIQISPIALANTSCYVKAFDTWSLSTQWYIIQGSLDFKFNPKKDLSSDTSMLKLSLYVNYSSEMLEISSTDATVVFLPSALLSFGKSQLADEEISQNQTLLLAVPNILSLQWQVEMIPTYNTTINLPQALPCYVDSFNKSISSCNFRAANDLSHYPHKLRMIFVACQIDFPGTVAQFEMNPILIRRLSPIEDYFPFILQEDYHSKNNVTFSFKLSLAMNPLFEYLCQIKSDDFQERYAGVKLMDGDHRIGICSFKIEDLNRQYNSTVTIVQKSNDMTPVSNGTMDLQIGHIEYVPRYAVQHQEVFHDHRIKWINSSSLFYSNPIHRHGNFTAKLLNNEKSVVMDCTVEIEFGTIQCSGICDLGSLSLGKGVAEIDRVQLQYNGLHLINISSPFVLYAKSSASNIFPLALRKNQYPEIIQVSLFVQSPVFSFSEYAFEKLNIYCTIENPLISHIHFPAIVVNESLINCTFNIADLSNFTNLNPAIRFNFADVKALEILYVENGGQIFSLIEEGVMEYLSTNESPFISKDEMKTAQFRLYSHLPIHIQQFYRCSIRILSTNHTLWDEQDNVFTVVYHENENNTIINCTFTMNQISLLGAIDISLWFVQPGNAFQISSNNLRYIVIDPSAINRVEPLAARANVTTTFRIHTSFETFKDYGDVEFECVANSLSGSHFNNLTVPAVLDSNTKGLIYCSFFSDILDTVSVYIHSKLKSTNETYNILNEQFELLFVDNFFFEPSYGINAGNEIVNLFNFDGNVSNIVFDKFPELKFECTQNMSTVSCLTPDVRQSNISSFSSHFLSMDQKFLSLKYVIYEKRNITSLHPLVAIGGHKSIVFSLELNEPVSLQEGILTIQMSNIQNIIDYQIVDAEAVPSKKQIDVSFEHSFKDTCYEILTNYRNNALLTRRNSIPITNKVTFCSIYPRPLSFITENNTNIGYINQELQVKISLGGESLHSIIIDGIHCIMDGQDVGKAIHIINNDFICQLEAPTPSSKILELHYIHSEDGSKVKITTQNLTIYFVQQPIISSPLPDITIRDRENITISTGTSLTGEFLSTKTYGLKYYCQTLSNSKISVALYDDISKEFSCQVFKSDHIFHYVEQVVLTVESSEIASKLLLFSKNSISFSFSNKMILEKLTPFVFSFPHQELHINSSIQLQLDKSILSIEQLSCHYNTFSNSWISKARHSNQNNSVICLMEYGDQKLDLNTVVLINAELWIDTISLPISSVLQFAIFPNTTSFEQIPASGIVDESLMGTQFDTDIILPNITLYEYDIALTQHTPENIPSQIMDCAFHPNQKAYCIFNPTSMFTPLLISGKLSIKSLLANEKYTIPIKEFVLIVTDKISTAYPYIINRVGFASIVRDIFVKIDQRRFNFKISKFYCRFHFELSAPQQSEANVDESDPSKLRCKILNSNDEKVSHVIITSKIESHMPNFVSITSDNSTIYFLQNLDFYNKIGPASGGTHIAVTLSKSIMDHRKNTLGMKFRDRTRTIPLVDCAIEGNQTLRCVTPSITITQQLLSLGLSIYIDGIRSYDFHETFHFHRNVKTVDRIKPSNNLDIFSWNSTILVLNNFFPFIPSMRPVLNIIPNQYAHFNNSKIMCHFENRNSLHCPIYQTTLLLTDNSWNRINFNLSLSLNNENFDGLDNQFIQMIRSSNDVVFDEFIVNNETNKQIYIGKRHLVEIRGQNFISSEFVTIQFSDGSFVFNVFSDSPITPQRILATVPPLYDTWVQFPKVLQIYVSFDSKTFLFTGMNVTLIGLPLIKMSPSAEFVNQRVNSFALSNFPDIDIKPSHEGLQIYLHQEENYYLQDSLVELECNGNFSSCVVNATHVEKLTSNPGEWKLAVFTKQNGTSLLLPFHLLSPFQVIPSIEITRIHPSTVTSNVASIVTLEITNDISSHLSNLAIRYRLISRVSQRSLLEQSDIYGDCKIIDAEHIGSYIQVECDFPYPGNYEFYLSSNGGKTFVPKNQSISFSPMESIRFENFDDELLSTVFFRLETYGRIHLENIRQMPLDLSYLVIKSSILEIRVTLEELQPKFSNSTLDSVDIRIPALLELTNVLIDSLSFPFSASLSLTLNEGLHYVSVPIVILSSLRAPEIATVIPLSITRLNQHLQFSISARGHAISCFIIVESSDARHIIGGSISRSSQVYLCEFNERLVVPSDVSHVMLGLNSTEGRVGMIRITAYDIFGGNITNTNQGYHFGGYDITFFVEHDLMQIAQVSTVSGRFRNIPVPLRLVGNEDLIRENRTIKRTTFAFEAPRSEATLRSVEVTVSLNGLNSHIVGYFDYVACPITYETVGSACEKCRPGTFKNIDAIISCNPCPQATYANNWGSTECVSCPPDSTSPHGSDSIYNCECFNGTFINIASAVYQCEKCPEGATCSRNTSTPIPNPGFWNSGNAYHVILQCLPSRACPGGKSDHCAPGYTGYGCNWCEQGYYRSKSHCLRCGEFALGRLIGIICLIGLVVGLFFLITSAKLSHFTSFNIGLSLFQVIALFSDFDVNWPVLFQEASEISTASNFNLDFLAPQCWIPGLTYEVRLIFALCLPFMIVIFLILVYIAGIIQTFIASKIGHKIKWKYIASFNPLEWRKKEGIDESMFSMGKEIAKEKRPNLCIGILKFLMDIIVLVPNSLIWLRNFFIWCLKHPMTALEKRILRNQLINSFFTYLIVSYLFIMSNLSEVFNCQQQGGRFIFVSSPDIECYEGIWWFLFTITIICYSVFLVGCGFIFLYVYYRVMKGSKRFQRYSAVVESNSKDLKGKTTFQFDDFDLNQQFRFLIKRYKKKYFYFEILVMIKKLIFSTSRTFLSTMMVMNVNLIVSFISLGIHIRSAPFKKKMHNMMEYCVDICTMLLLFCGLILYLENYPISFMEDIVSILSLMIMVASVIIVSALALWDSYTRRRKEYKKWRKDVEREKKMGRRGVKFHEVDRVDAMKQDVRFSLFQVKDSSSEDDCNDMNEIITDLFGTKRLKKKLKLKQRNGN